MTLTKEGKLALPYPVKSNLASYKEVDTDSRTVKMIVNTYNYFDYDQDVLRMGCAKKSIQDRGAKSEAVDKILHLLFHDTRQIVGKSQLEAETIIDGREVLYAESYLPETTDGEDTLIKYNTDMYNQHSIGFNYLQLEWVERGSENWDKILRTLINPDEAEKYGYLWDVSEIALYEYSTVGFGANKETPQVKLMPMLGTKSTNKNIQYQAVVQKMNALVSKANKQEVKNKKLFELEMKQLQQMIYEMTVFEPSKKVTPQEPITEDTFDTNKFIEIINSKQ